MIAGSQVLRHLARCLSPAPGLCCRARVPAAASSWPRPSLLRCPLSRQRGGAPGSRDVFAVSAAGRRAIQMPAGGRASPPASSPRNKVAPPAQLSRCVLKYNSNSSYPIYLLLYRILFSGFHDCGLNLNSRGKFEPGPGFEPRTSISSLALYHLSY